MDNDGMLKEIRDDIKTLLTASATTGQRIEHVEEEVNGLITRVDRHNHSLSNMLANKVNKKDCESTRNKMENRVVSRQKNWMGILGVSAAFMAAGAAIVAVIKAGML